MTESDASAQTPNVSASATAAVFQAPDLSRVFTDEHGYVMHSLRRLGVPERDLEDVAHDTFIVIHRKLASYDPQRPLRPFLFGIAYRVASDYRRRARHRYEQFGHEREFSSAQKDPGAELESRRAQELVIEALARLDPERCAVFVMIEIDGHSPSDVATSLEIPVNTVYSRLRVARAEFAGAVRRLQLSGGAR